MRLNPDLVAAAEKVGAIQKRSIPKQIEYWAELGKAVERTIDISDVYAIIQGIKKVQVEPVASLAVPPGDVFDDLEKGRKNGRLAEKVTSANVYYEASLTRPGLLDRVNAATGVRQTGQFHNGKFKVQ
jgi:hypothetical protein